MRYLLDTNVFVEWLRRRPGNERLWQRLEISENADLCTSEVVRFELLRGALRSRDPLSQQLSIKEIFDRLSVFPVDAQVAKEAANVSFQLERQGTPIGPYDLLIAATAIAYSLTLVTHNTREFSRIPGLLFEDWQAL